MKIKYVGVITPAILKLQGKRRRCLEVAKGDVIEVEKEQYEELIKQGSNWKSADWTPVKKVAEPIIKKISKKRGKK